MVASLGYEDICHELPNLDPMEIPKMIEQVPMLQLNELSKPLQQLLNQNQWENSHQKVYTTATKWRTKYPQH